jgi:hypothetical protein
MNDIDTRTEYTTNTSNTLDTSYTLMNLESDLRCTWLDTCIHYMCCCFCTCCNNEDDD